MSRAEGEEAQIVAVLHDVVEDTKVTLDDLRRAGFKESILEAVRCVTHFKDQPYADYVVGCKHNAIARQVKLGDLADNCRLGRSILRPQRVQADLARIHRYLLSYKFLTDQRTGVSVTHVPVGMNNGESLLTNLQGYLNEESRIQWARSRLYWVTAQRQGDSWPPDRWIRS